MKIMILVTLVFGLAACQPQPVNQLAQQQHFICTSLIEGFLKTQHLGQYELYSLRPTLHTQAVQRDYRYKASSDSTMKVNLPRQHDLSFQCAQNSAQRYEVRLIDQGQNQQQVLLSLDLPPQKTIDTLTAFALKTQ